MGAQGLLRSSRIKIDRAKASLHQLELAIRGFSDRKPYELKHEHDKDSGEIILVYYPTDNIPDEWSAIIGEMLFNLRSSLDLAVHELTVIETGGPLKNTEFPVFDDKNAFFSTKKNGDPAPNSGLYKIRGLRKKTIDVIEAMQPYNIRKQGSEPILSLLHEMNIVDKHRELHIFGCLPSSAKILFTRDAPGFIHLDVNFGAKLDQRAEIARLKLESGLDTNEYLTAEINIEITFDYNKITAFKRPEEVTKTMKLLISGAEIILSRVEKSLS